MGHKDPTATQEEPRKTIPRVTGVNGQDEVNETGKKLSERERETDKVDMLKDGIN